MDISREATIRNHFDELKSLYPGLALFEDTPGHWVVRGNLHFWASYGNLPEIDDTFEIEISLPSAYPSVPPSVKETKGRIPQDIDYHVFPSGNFCLGAPVEVHRKFLEEPTLVHFVQNQVIPFLYAFCYKQQFGVMPFGELAHGYSGILQYYSEILKTTNGVQILNFLKILADNDYRGHILCPCQSGWILRKCHGKALRDLSVIHAPEWFERDWMNVFDAIPEDERQGISRSHYPRSFLKYIDKKSKQKTSMSPKTDSEIKMDAENVKVSELN